jgi:hypothetical protein
MIIAGKARSIPILILKDNNGSKKLLPLFFICAKKTTGTAGGFDLFRTPGA